MSLGIATKASCTRMFISWSHAFQIIGILILINFHSRYFGHRYQSKFNARPYINWIQWYPFSDFRIQLAFYLISLFVFQNVFLRIKLSHFHWKTSIFHRFQKYFHWYENISELYFLLIIRIESADRYHTVLLQQGSKVFKMTSLRGVVRLIANLAG